MYYRRVDCSGASQVVLVVKNLPANVGDIKDLRLPLFFGLRHQGPCRVGTGETGYVFSEEWNSACLSSCSQEDPLEKGKATHSWVVHRQRSLAGYTVHGVAESDMTE